MTSGRSPNPPTERRPPLPGEDEALYIGRDILHQGTVPSGHYVFDYIIPSYNPEWVSIDVRGRNYIVSGFIRHECLPKNPPPPQSLDLSFVITNGGSPLGACCVPGAACLQLTAAACQTAGGTSFGDGSICTPNPCVTPTGACCTQGALASMSNYTAADCATAGGTYIGDGISCTPNPCVTQQELVAFRVFPV